MPVSMSFAPGGIHSSPAARAAIDEQRLRARADRQSSTPGPGSYDAKASAGNQNRPSSAFKSKTGRLNDTSTKDVGDPGMYNPSFGNDLASKTTSTFNKAQQSGVGGFGTTSKRAQLSAISDAPGPGQYSVKAVEKPQGKHHSAFASQTKRGAYIVKATDTPGVGAYQPANFHERVTGGDAAFKSKDNRFKDSGGRSDIVGPGSYAQDALTMSKSTTDKNAASASAFGTTAKREYNYHISEAPGPGSYDQKAAVDNRPTSAFKSKSERNVDTSTKDVGDPGMYNPSFGDDLASRTTSTFNKAQQSGVGGFGTTSKRAQLSAISDAPGPGQYTMKVTEKPQGKHHSAFASQTKRGAYIVKAADTPGVGSYQPTTNLQERVTGGDAAFKSGENRFKSSARNEDHLGPGTYAQENNTIMRQSVTAQGKISSAFASTSLRDGFLGGH